MIPERSVPSRRAQLAACALFLLGAWALFFWPMLIDGMVPVFRDILDTTAPLGHYIGERLRAGHLPQWFPYEGLGEPFIGQLNEGAFHPTSWLYAVLSVPTALRWELLLGYLAAACGQFLLSRRLGMSLTASILAAVIFAFSGYAISLSNVLPYLWGMASLPWLGLCAAQVFTRERPWPWVAALALCWATIVVAGDSHSALFGGLVVVFVGAQTGGLRRLPLCILGSLLAVGIAGAELLPAIDIVRAGPRANWSEISNVRISAVWALHPYRLPELLFPNWIPAPTHVFFSNERYAEGGVWALSVFAGAPAVALALAGLLSRTRRGLLAGALALLGFWLALGYHGGLEPLLRQVLPILNVLRYPEKHLAIWTFGLSLASAAGLDHLREKPGWKMPVALAVTACACAAGALILPAEAALRVWPRLAQSPLHVPLLQHAWHDGLFATAAALAASATILAAERRRPGAIAFLPLAVFLELWVANGGLIGVAPASVLTDVSRLCAAARGAGGARDGLRVVNASSRVRFSDELKSPEVWAAITLNLMQPASNVLCGIGAVWSLPVLSNEPRAVREVLGRSELPPALLLYGFGLYIRAYPEDRPMPEETVVDAVKIKGKTLLLVKRPAAPRAYAATPRWVPDAATARAEVKQRGLALVSGPVLVGSGAPFPGAGSAGTVHIADYQPEHVVLDVQMERDGAVILNDLDWPGWAATLDGAPARIYNANALARAVLVPAGAHRVEMAYALPGLRSGLALSAASLLLCAGLVLSRFARRKRPGGAHEAASIETASRLHEHAIQRAYWADEDRAHFLWQTSNPYISATESALLAGVAAVPGERLLEIGCGEGANLRNLGARIGGAAIFAIDFSLAKAGFVGKSGVATACADAAWLPFRDRAFDAVLVRDLLHHVPDQQRVLEEAVRVLKPGGRLTVIEPNGRNPIIASMALFIPAERGMLASRAGRALEEARAAGLTGLRIEEHQALPISRVLLHYRLGLPWLARSPAVRACLSGLERAASLLPRSLWSYFVLSGMRPIP